MYRSINLFLYNLIIFIIKKIRFGRRWLVHPLQRISTNARIKLFDDGIIQIGRNCQIESGSDLQVHGNGKLIIGAGTYMNRYCMISAQDSVSIGDNCMFGPSVKVFDNNHKFSRQYGVATDLKTAPITIGNNCWLASNVIILKGTTIGDNCVIGAGCVVSGNIPNGSMVKNNQSYSIEEITA